ncbi:MAG: class II aldolase/adducin family protein [Candidatus Krumholzibacteriia bacterium]
MTDEVSLRRELVRIGRLMDTRGYVVAAEGNLSARLGGDLFLVTPSGARKGELIEQDLLIVKASGVPRDGARGQPTSEWGLHREIYARRPDLAAVCHGHPPYATARAALRKPLPGDLLTEIAATLGEVPVAPFAVPGTDDVARSASSLLERHPALLLANHGAVAAGRTPEEAFQRLEMVERLAQVTFLVEQQGGGVRLSSDQVAAVRRLVGVDDKTDGRGTAR